MPKNDGRAVDDVSIGCLFKDQKKCTNKRPAVIHYWNYYLALRELVVETDGNIVSPPIALISI